MGSGVVTWQVEPTRPLRICLSPGKLGVMKYSSSFLRGGLESDIRVFSWMSRVIPIANNLIPSAIAAMTSISVLSVSTFGLPSVMITATFMALGL